MALRTLTKLLFLCCLLAPMIAFGQNPSMTSSGSGSWAAAAISNFPDCTTGGVNCWHASSVIVSNVFSGNGFTAAVKPDCQWYTYQDYPSNTWTLHLEYGCVFGLQKGGDGNLYALKPNPTLCTTGVNGSNPAQWNPGNNTWTVLNNTCFNDWSFAPDRGPMVIAKDTNGALWKSTDNGHSFSILPLTGYPYTTVRAASSAAGTYVAVRQSDNSVQEWNGASYVALGFTATFIATDGVSSIYIQGLDGNTYHYDGSTEKLMAGSSGTTFIADGDGMNVWRIGPTVGGNNLYRYSESGIQFTRNYSGTVGCKDGVPPSLCNTFTHTTSLQLSVQGHSGPLVHGTPFNGSGQWGLAASVNANDLFSCIENIGCDPSEDTGNMQCSGGGNNFDSGTPHLTWSFNNITQNQNLGLTGGCWQGSGAFKIQYCRYRVAPACSPATADPNYVLPSIVDLNFPFYGSPNPNGWISESPLCWSVLPVGSRAGSWGCIHVPGTDIEYFTPTNPSFACTETP